MLGLKAHQPTLHDAVAARCAYEQAEDFAPCPHPYSQTVNKGRGRMATRPCGAIGDPAYRAYVDPHHAWPDRQSWVRVPSERRLGDLITTETRDCLSRLPPWARTLLGTVRGHGGIEPMPWTLDIALREDESRIRTGQAAHHRAVLRRWALNRLRQAPTAKGGIAAQRQQAGDPRVGGDEAYLLV